MNTIKTVTVRKRAIDNGEKMKKDRRWEEERQDV